MSEGAAGLADDRGAPDPLTARHVACGKAFWGQLAINRDYTQILTDWFCLSCARPHLCRAYWVAVLHHKMGMPRQARRFSHCDAVLAAPCAWGIFLRPRWQFTPCRNPCGQLLAIGFGARRSGCRWLLCAELVLLSNVLKERFTHGRLCVEGKMQTTT